MQHKRWIPLLALALLTLTAHGQLIYHPKADLHLKMEQAEGSNGAGVAWNPERQLYHAAFAGNASYPLEVFDAQGQNIYQRETGFDVRGLWFNPKENALEGNAYEDAGYFRIQLNFTGLPSGSAFTFLDGRHQPDDHAVGAFNPKKKEVLFYHDGEIVRYKAKNGKQSKAIRLDHSDASSLNTTALVYTGQKGYEYGLFDYSTGTLHLFNKKGAFVNNAILPADSPDNSVFNLSYANQRLWLFDKTEREWIGYRVFR